MKLTFQRNHNQLKIYFGEIIHLQLRLENLNGFQSWIDGPKEFYIEFYFSDGSTIKSVYENKNNWIKVLKCLDEKC